MANRDSAIYYVYRNGEFVGSYNTVGEEDAILAACDSIRRDGGEVSEDDQFRADLVE